MNCSMWTLSSTNLCLLVIFYCSLREESFCHVLDFCFLNAFQHLLKLSTFGRFIVCLGFLSSHVCRIIWEYYRAFTSSFELVDCYQVDLFLLWPAAGYKSTFTEWQQTVAFLCFCQSCLFQSVISWARPENHSVQF